MTGNNPNLDLANINAFIKFCEILSMCSQDIEQKRNSDINQGHNSNKQKMTGNNPTVNCVNINAFFLIGEILSICSKDIELKINF